MSASRLLLLACLLGAQATAAIEPYEITYHACPRPDRGVVEMEVRLSGEILPSRIVLHADRQRHKNFTATDPLRIDGSQVTWQPRGHSSRLQYQFVVNHERAAHRYDSLMNDNWAIFRGEKLVPRASVTAPPDLQSRATLHFELPERWSVMTPYEPAGARRYTINDASRRFDQPKGWMLAGLIGQRAETIDGVLVLVGAPVGDSVRRQDTLAFLNWTLPQLLEVFPAFPRRLLIVSAGDPMWRGGLSGPASMFLHSSRPLISENRTSTLLHELVHIAMGLRADEESDWIVEGLAEFYSLETLRRSNSISARRHAQAVAALEKWARRAPTLFATESSGATTARAVLALLAADREIRQVTGGKASLDEVARALAQERGTVTLARLQKTARQVAGRPLHSLQREQLTKRPAAPAA